MKQLLSCMDAGLPHFKRFCYCKPCLLQLLDPLIRRTTLHWLGKAGKPEEQPTIERKEFA